MKVRINAWKWNAGVATMRRYSNDAQYGWNWVSKLFIGQIFEVERTPAFNEEFPAVRFQFKLGDTKKNEWYVVELEDVEILEE